MFQSSAGMCHHKFALTRGRVRMKLKPRLLPGSVDTVPGILLGALSVAMGLSNLLVATHAVRPLQKWPLPLLRSSVSVT